MNKKYVILLVASMLVATSNNLFGMKKFFAGIGKLFRKKRKTGNTPLIGICRGTQSVNQTVHQNVVSKKLELVLSIIRAGVDVNVAGVDVNFKDFGGKTPLHIACKRGKIKSVSLLIQAGASVNAKDYDKKTPLHTACRNCEQSVPLLIQAGANVNAKDFISRTPLHIACQYNRKLVSLLIKAGANINAKGYEKETPLHIACRNREQSESVSLLIQSGADVNVINRFGETPLHIACRYNRESVSLLIKAGANINAKDHRGRTALKGYWQDPEIAKILIKNGAKISRLRHLGSNCLQRERVEVITKLERTVGAEKEKWILKLDPSQISDPSQIGALVSFISSESILMYAKQMALAKLLDFNTAHPHKVRTRKIKNQALKSLFKYILFNASIITKRKFKNIVQFAQKHDLKDKNGMDIIEAVIRFSKKRQPYNNRELKNMLQKKLRNTSKETFTHYFTRYIEAAKARRNKKLFRELYNISITYRNFTEYLIPEDIMIQILDFAEVGNIFRKIHYLDSRKYAAEEEEWTSDDEAWTDDESEGEASCFDDEEEEETT